MSENELLKSILKAHHEHLIQKVLDACESSEPVVEISGLKRRCGLTTSIAHAVARLKSGRVLIACLDKAHASDMRRMLDVLKPLVSVDVQTAPEIEGSLNWWEGCVDYDVIIVDNFIFVPFARALQIYTKKLVLCQTGKID